MHARGVKSRGPAATEATEAYPITHPLNRRTHLGFQNSSSKKKIVHVYINICILYTSLWSATVAVLTAWWRRGCGGAFMTITFPAAHNCFTLDHITTPASFQSRIIPYDIIHPASSYTLPAPPTCVRPAAAFCRLDMISCFCQSWITRVRSWYGLVLVTPPLQDHIW